MDLAAEADPTKTPRNQMVHVYFGFKVVPIWLLWVPSIYYLGTWTLKEMAARPFPNPEILHWSYTQNPIGIEVFPCRAVGLIHEAKGSTLCFLFSLPLSLCLCVCARTYSSGICVATLKWFLGCPSSFWT